MPRPLKHTGLGRTKKPRPGDVDVVREASRSGASKKGVAAAVGISVTTLDEWFQRHPEIQEAFDVGREHERKALHTKLYDSAMEGNVVAALFLLKARHGYREGDQAETANRVSINFQLPGAQPLEKFMGMVDGPRTTTAE